MELTAYLRSELSNKVISLVKKDKCEKCGSMENLEVHHVKQFIVLLDETLELLGLEYKDTKDYTKEELNKIRLIVLGKHMDIKYKTLCLKCHDDIHKKTKSYKRSIKKPKNIRKMYNNMNRVLDGKQGDFMRLIENIKNNKYKDMAIIDKENKILIIKKKDICKLIDIDKRKLKERVLDKPTVKKFLDDNKIINQGQKIIIPYDN